MVKNTGWTVWLKSSKIRVFWNFCYVFNVSQGVLSICFELTQSTQIKLFSRLLVLSEEWVEIVMNEMRKQIFLQIHSMIFA